MPATSANLGPGFDSLGLALSWYDEVCAEITDSGVRVMVVGEGAGELPTGEDNLVARVVRDTLRHLGVCPPGLALTCRNQIPQARGLGSSSAAIVAGVLLARALAPAAADQLDDAEVLRIAAQLEGHPDNVAPCLFGGFTIAWTGSDGARAVRMVPAPAIRPTVFVPAEHGLTAAARAALPGSVPHPDAAHSAGRSALLVHALTTEPRWLLDATEDRLHQTYRAVEMPATAALVARLRQAGVAAVVSGAGPSVLALSSVPSGFDPGAGMSRHDLAVDLDGAQVQTGMLVEPA